MTALIHRECNDDRFIYGCLLCVCFLVRFGIAVEIHVVRGGVLFYDHSGLYLCRIGKFTVLGFENDSRIVICTVLKACKRTFIVTCAVGGYGDALQYLCEILGFGNFKSHTGECLRVEVCDLTTANDRIQCGILSKGIFGSNDFISTGDLDGHFMAGSVKDLNMEIEKCRFFIGHAGVPCAAAREFICMAVKDKTFFIEYAGGRRVTRLIDRCGTKRCNTDIGVRTSGVDSHACACTTGIRNTLVNVPNDDTACADIVCLAIEMLSAIVKITIFNEIIFIRVGSRNLQNIIFTLLALTRIECVFTVQNGRIIIKTVNDKMVGIVVRGRRTLCFAVVGTGRTVTRHDRDLTCRGVFTAPSTCGTCRVKVAVAERMTKLMAERANGKRCCAVDHFAAFDVVCRNLNTVKSIVEAGLMRIIVGLHGGSCVFVACRNERNHKLGFIHELIAVLVVYGEIHIVVSYSRRKCFVAFRVACGSGGGGRHFDGNTHFDDTVIFLVLLCGILIIFLCGNKAEVAAALYLKISLQPLGTVAEEHFRPIGVILMLKKHFAVLKILTVETRVVVYEDHEKRSILRAPITVIKIGNFVCFRRHCRYRQHQNEKHCRKNCSQNS